MSRTGASSLMVVDSQRLVGMVSLRDLLRFLSVKLDLEPGDVETPEKARETLKEMQGV
jgi:CBS domain-containing protein